MSQIILLLSGNGASAALLLFRNLYLAHLLGLEGYGSAMVVLTVLGMVELTTNLGLPQQLVSRRDGARVHVQATLHGAQLVRGFVGACVTLAMAHPVALMLDAPNLAILVSLGALSPLCLGFMHLDAYRAQRHRKHEPQVLLLIIPAAVSCAAIWLLHRTINGPQLVLVMIAAQSITAVVLSHLLARRAYTVRWSRQEAPRLLTYGLPLAGNGVLLCAVLHLEKLIAGHVLGIEALALVAMGAGLTMTPALMASRSLQAYHLPRLRDGSGARLAEEIVMERGCFAGAAIGILLLIASKSVLPFVGQDFDPVAQLLPLFVILAAIRLPKSALATIALASGRTYVPGLANAPRLLAAPVLWWALSTGGGLAAMLYVAICAEALGLLIGAWVCRKHVRLPRLELLIFAATCIALAMEHPGVAALLLVLAMMQTKLGRMAARQGMAV